MDFFFADDSLETKPSRQRVGKLVAIGGIHVPDQTVRPLEKQIGDLCDTCGFPTGEPFKWSPGPELWMHDHLRGHQRQSFFIAVLTLLEQADVTAIVVIEDASCRPATCGLSAEMDVTRMFLERADQHLKAVRCQGIVITDRPGGGAEAQNRFLADCAEALQTGTEYVSLKRIAFVLSTPSKLVRLLQAADMVTSCTRAFVAGEKQFSPPVFNAVKRILRSEGGRIGGVGLKIHPDFKYANLYHWLLGDTHVWRPGPAIPLPSPDRAYSSSPDVY